MDERPAAVDGLSNFTSTTEAGIADLIVFCTAVRGELSLVAGSGSAEQWWLAGPSSNEISPAVVDERRGERERSPAGPPATTTGTTQRASQVTSVEARVTTKVSQGSRGHGAKRSPTTLLCPHTDGVGNIGTMFSGAALVMRGINGKVSPVMTIKPRWSLPGNFRWST